MGPSVRQAQVLFHISGGQVKGRRQEIISRKLESLGECSLEMLLSLISSFSTLRVHFCKVVPYKSVSEQHPIKRKSNGTKKFDEHLESEVETQRFLVLAFEKSIESMSLNMGGISSQVEDTHRTLVGNN